MNEIFAFARDYEDDWSTRGACINSDPEAWFPNNKGAWWRRSGAKAAIATCLTCPVRERCLDAALEFEAGDGLHLRHGIWGGLTPHQRLLLDPAAYAHFLSRQEKAS